MASQTYYVTGTAMYPKIFERNRDRGEYHKDTDGACTIDLIVDKEGQDIIKKSGSRLRPQITDDGLKYKFKRKWEDPVSKDFGGAPQVVDREGNDWDDSVSIGNGSVVEVAFDVYDTKLGKGTRLTGVKVITLIEYEDNEGGGAKKLPF